MNGVRIGRIAGIPLHLHWSTLLIVALVTTSLAGAALPAVVPDASSTTLVVAGLIGALGLLVSIVAHELCHALVARRFAIPVARIDLWALGGVAHLTRDASTPGQEAAIAVSGPLASLAIGGVAAVGAFALDGIVGATLGYLAGINLLLGVFNLLPGAPLDGGRVLRAALWARRGDAARAGVQAATAGRWLGGGLAALGLVQVLTGGPGFTLVLVGWFIAQSAAAERLVHQLRMSLRDRSAGSVAQPSAELPEWSTAAWAAEQPGVQPDGLVVVRNAEGELDGYVTAAQLRAIPAAERMHVLLRELVVPLGTLPAMAASERADGLVERMRSLGSTVVVRDGRSLVGFVTPANVQSLLPRR